MRSITRIRSAADNLRRIKDVIRAAFRFKPWDWSYLLRLEQACLKSMAMYLRDCAIHENSEHRVRNMELAVRLASVILEDDTALHHENKTFTLTKRVNARNWKRFLTAEPKSPLFMNELRIQKALYLYNKLRWYKLTDWWD